VISARFAVTRRLSVERLSGRVGRSVPDNLRRFALWIVSSLDVSG
jgi:hypothetical protein